MNGTEILLARRKTGLHQWQLAQLIGLPPARLSEMELGRRPIPPELEVKIKQALKKVALKEI